MPTIDRDFSRPSARPSSSSGSTSSKPKRTRDANRADRTKPWTFFWVRHDAPEKRGGPVTLDDIEGLRTTLTGLLEGRVDRERASDSGFVLPATPSSVETVVRFIEGDDGSFATLEVETGDRSGLLLALAQALFQQRVQIVASQVKTNGTRVFDRFSIVELDGKPIGAPRRLEIQVAVLTAVDPLVGR